MSYFRITGPTTLKGEIAISGAKNAALKILPAAILADSVSTIQNVPDILDIRKMIGILQSIGAEIEFYGNTAVVNPKNVKSFHPDEKLIQKLRGSIVLAGPLLAKFGRAVFSQPGGCLIGARSIDDHLDLFAQLGIGIHYKDGTYNLSGRPRATKVVLKKMSVTATENAIMATVLSPGKTEIHAAAAEPEIADLAKYLNSMGAKISGAGTHDIEVEGVKALHGVEHSILPDRIEAGTYLIAAIATNSSVTIGPVIPGHLDVVLKRLLDAGARFEIIARSGQNYIKTHSHAELKATSIDTRPYPGFPTDLQSPYAVLMTQAKGNTKIFETMFEGRFAYLEELKLMRSKTEILNPHEFSVSGPTRLYGTEISSKDIRGGAALVIAGMIANKITMIEDAEFIDRGYEKMDEKLNAAGAQIERIEKL